MGQPKPIKGDDPYNVRLDLFLQQLEIQEEKRKQIVSYVEDLTLKALQDQNKAPLLRLNKPDVKEDA